MDMIINNAKCEELSAKIVRTVVNRQIVEMIQQNTNVCVAIRITKKSLMKT